MIGRRWSSPDSVIGYIAMARPPAEHWACDLRTKRASLADALFALKSRARTPGLILAKVPPFAHLLLSRADNFDQVIDGMLELRWKCRRLRAAESAIYEQLSSYDVSWLKKMREQERFLRGWDQMIAACGEASTAEMEFGNSGAHLLRHLNTPLSPSGRAKKRSYCITGGRYCGSSSKASRRRIGSKRMRAC